MASLSRIKASILYGLLLIITITINLLFSPFGNLALCTLLSVATAITIVYFLCKKTPTKQPIQLQPTTTERAKSLLSGNSVNTDPPQAPRPPRLHYLDNLKSILTAIVVIHHTTMAFSAAGGWYYNIANYHNVFQIPSMAVQVLDQSYFMCLFFFISGYFTPISCQRKGIRLFLCDKFKRLGIPFIIYELLLGPMVGFMTNYLFISHNSWAYGADPGPCWFLLWLLIFNVCYTTIDQMLPFLRIKFPAIWKLLVFGVLFGVIQAFVVGAIVDANYIFMPITYGSLPFDILFFGAGVAAKYNGWLVDAIPNLSNCYVITIRVLTALLALAWIAVFTFLYVVDFGHGFIPKKNASDHDCDDDDQHWEMYQLLFLGSSYLLSGICTTVVSVTMVQFAYVYFNFTTAKTKFFSKSAYSVYILHPLVVVPVTWSFEMILKAADGQTMYFCDGKGYSKTHFSENWLIWLGWMYSVVLSLVILWPLAWYIRQLPGLNKIL